MDPTEESGKTRVQRIPIDYYRKRGRLYWWRWWMAGGGLLVAGIYVAFALLSPRKAMHFSTGPISSVHAAFEQDCGSCHRDWTPIAGDAWRWDPHHAVQRTAASCRNCHSVQAHHFASLNDAARSLDSQCAHCHREHRGRDRSLIAQEDRLCTQCHADLDAFRETGSSLATAPDIQKFTLASHGEFRSLQSAESPQGRIKFNHALHMQPGQVAPGRRGGTRVGMLEPSHRDDYRRPGQDEQTLVQLACNDCHAFSEGSADASVSRVGGSRYSQPIRYEDHCAACHPLTTVGQEEDQPPLPHGNAPAAVRKLLRDRLAGLQMDAMRRGSENSQSPNAVLIPGKERSPAALQANQEDLEMIDVRVDGLTDRLRDQCRLCHLDEDIDTPHKKKMLPSRWLRSGQFDHGAHAGMNCLICHPHADPERSTLTPVEAAALGDWLAQLQSPPTVATGDDRETTMITGIESCVPCHRDSLVETPTAFAAMETLRGHVSLSAPDNCLTCHRYHWSRPEPIAPEFTASTDARDR